MVPLTLAGEPFGIEATRVGDRENKELVLGGQILRNRAVKIGKLLLGGQFLEVKSGSDFLGSAGGRW